MLYGEVFFKKQLIYMMSCSIYICLSKIAMENQLDKHIRNISIYK